MRLERQLFVPILLVLIPLAGCSLKKTAPEKYNFIFHSSRPGDPNPGPPGLTLQVKELSISPRYESRGFVYRTDDVSWQSDFYNQFFINPENLLTEEIGAWFTHSGLFEQVTPLTGIFDPTYGLLGRVNKLYGDYQDAGNPTAILEIQFFLVEDPLRQASIAFDRIYREEEPFDGSPAGLVRGWDEALVRILTAFEADVRELVE